MLFEIRSYHVKPNLFEAYKKWGTAEAAPYLSRQLDVVGFWVSTGDEPVVTGEDQDKLGPANVTWIIKWRDLAHRNAALPEIMSSPEWKDISSRRPGGTGTYLRTESKYAESVSIGG